MIGKKIRFCPWIPIFGRFFQNHFIRLGNQLTWKIGNGDKIVLGMDPFIGRDHFYKLSGTLIFYLFSPGINMLSHIRNPLAANHDLSYWFLSSDLGLQGGLEIEWKNFIVGIKHLVIKLGEKEYRLVWSWNKSQLRS